jgi:hypothetical protein
MDKKEKSLLISREWQKNNRQKAYEQHKKYRDKNKEKIKAMQKRYYENNRDSALERRRVNTKIRKENDPNYKFSENIRSLISISFKKYKKSLKTEQILGCTLEFFRNYILSKCSEGMTIKDFHKYGYQIDHIIPISSGTSEEEVIKLNHYTNLQPLWWRDNIIKSNKI